ncbi:hypothetical protein XU18_2214 [Perkinsela sp. CCAP 1560/4]|nr:hypothetical protein XU18_2214 [Perkinsela sp. CCAP 1560/4]|eukprot:KNH07037.1 hypothetical protein XU18_2214 [Perkinsela sp. CCAP 1560/4]
MLDLFHRRRSFLRRLVQTPWKTEALVWIGKLLPAACFVCIHYGYPDLDDRISRWGANFALLKDSAHLHRAITHVAVHVSDEHLWKNVISYIVAACSFPSTSDIFSFYGVFFGGALAGLFATNVEQHRHRRDTAAKYSFGLGLVERIVLYAHKKWQHRVEFCGASAAVYSLLCYNAAKRRQVSSALSLLFAEILSSTLSSEYFPDGRGDGLGAQLMHVGHWAHAGGIVFGLCAGLLDSP